MNRAAASTSPAWAVRRRISLVTRRLTLQIGQLRTLACQLLTRQLTALLFGAALTDHGLTDRSHADKRSDE